MKVFGFVVHADGRAPLFFSFDPDYPTSARAAFDKATLKAQQLRHRGLEVSPVACTHRPRGSGWNFVPTVSDLVHDCVDVDLSEAEFMDDVCVREEPPHECRPSGQSKAKSSKKQDPRWRVRKKTTTRSQQLVFETFFDVELQARLHFDVLAKSLRSGETLVLVSPSGRVMRKVSAKDLDS